MKIFNAEIEFLKKVENQNDTSNHRKLISEQKLKQMKAEFPKIPAELISYLLEIGAGSFRECQFQVAEDLFELEALGLQNDYEIKPGIKFFGDNYCGDFSGFDFDRNDGCVVELWHETGELYYTGQTFKEYIREQMLMDKNGNDLRET